MRNKDEEATLKITMRRDTLYCPSGKPRKAVVLKGPRTDEDGKTRPGTTHEVGEVFARFCVNKGKADYATEADEKATKKTGPITAEDFVGKKIAR